MATIKFKDGNTWESVKIFNTSSQNKQVLKSDEICDYFGIKADGSHALATTYNYGCTSYIDCHNVTNINIPMVQETTKSGFGLAFYDESKTFISFVENPVGSSLGVVTKTIDVPSEAYYFRTTFFNYNSQKTYGYFECTIYYNDDATIVNGKRPYQSGVISFAPAVDQSIINYDNTDGTQSIITPNFKDTTGNLILPTNYTNDGKPVKLIMLAHGLLQYQNYQEFGTVDFSAKANYLASKGFAVFDCNGARNTQRQGQFPSCGMRQFTEAYRKCYEYIIEHYNIDPNMHVVGCSAGGMVACNYARRYSVNVKGLILLCSVVNVGWFLPSNASAYKKDIIEEYTGSRSYDATKYRGLDPSLDTYTIDNTTYVRPYNFPVLGIKTTQDDVTLNEQLQTYFDNMIRTGADVQLRVVNNLTHDNIVRDNTPGIDDTIVNWFNMN